MKTLNQNMHGLKQIFCLQWMDTMTLRLVMIPWILQLAMNNAKYVVCLTFSIITKPSNSRENHLQGFCLHFLSIQGWIMNIPQYANGLLVLLGGDIWLVVGFYAHILCDRSIVISVSWPLDTWGLMVEYFPLCACLLLLNTCKTLLPGLSV